MLILSFQSTAFIRTASNYVSAGNTFLRLEGREGAPCAIFEDHLECGIPEGVGLTSTLYLTAEYTTSFGTDTTFDIFQLDSFSYAGPNIFNISGCPEDGCDRRGNDTIEIRGTNFGMFDALVFVNREMCTWCWWFEREARGFLFMASFSHTNRSAHSNITKILARTQVRTLYTVPWTCVGIRIVGEVYATVL